VDSDDDDEGNFFQHSRGLASRSGATESTVASTSRRMNMTSEIDALLGKSTVDGVSRGQSKRQDEDELFDLL
jgi:hypothetical protein